MDGTSILLDGGQCDESDVKHGSLTMHAVALRLNASIAGVVIPRLAPGVIYFVIAFATGASAGASIIGGIVVASIAVTIALTLRAVFKRRAGRLTNRAGQEVDR
jgi:TRAP-type C4-dicarboxylate transport system permease large subunit